MRAGFPTLPEDDARMFKYREGTQHLITFKILTNWPVHTFLELRELQLDYLFFYGFFLAIRALCITAMSCMVLRINVLCCILSWLPFSSPGYIIRLTYFGFLSIHKAFIFFKDCFRMEVASNIKGSSSGNNSLLTWRSEMGYHCSDDKL